MCNMIWSGKKWCLVLCMVVLSIVLHAENYHQHISFVENKGQWAGNILYKSELKEGALFFERNMVTYAFVESEYLEKIAAIKSGKSDVILDTLAWHYAYKMHFLHANEHVHIVPEGEDSEYYNYYIGNDAGRWSSHVRKYSSIKYEHVYDGINIKYYERYGTYKYDVEVQPGAQVEQVKFLCEGAEKLSVKEGNLYLRIGKFMVIENKPYAYQWNDAGEQVPVACAFKVEGNEISFVIGKYDYSRVLIIDPTIVFASYSSSTADNFGYTATYDRYGNVYGGGTVYGVGYPTTVGAYQGVFKGGSCDVGITKFSPDGHTRLYSTYIGGTGTDVPHSLYVNNNDELYVLMSTSSADFPVTQGCYQGSFRGGAACRVTSINYYGNGSDVSISRFNASGTQLLSSTYFGGSGNDGLNLMMAKNYADEIRGDLQIDVSGNVYVASSTASADMPITANAIQSVYKGVQDGFVAKFSYDLKKLIFASYIGGSNIDAVYNMELDAQGNMYICGGTKSGDFPVTQNAYITTAPGYEDGFISKISTNGTQLMRSTYVGTRYTDQTFLVKLDEQENVYVVGQTTDSASSWTYNVKWSGGTGQFLTKFDNDLAKMLWSTSFGDANLGYELVPTAMMVDVCGRIHISGWGGTTNMQQPLAGLPITNDAFKVVPDMGSGDFYFITIDKDASDLVFASYYGGNCTIAGEHVDGGTSRFDRKGVIYQAVCAGCAGCNNFPVTPGVIGPTNNSSNCNMAVVKIAFPMAGVIADFDIPAIVCAPFTAVIDNRSQLRDSSSTLYEWNFGDGGSSTDVSPMHVYNESGLYQVQLIVSDTGSCNVADTLEKEILVLANRLDTLPTIYTCKGDMVQIGVSPYADTNLTYAWYPATGLSSADVSNPYFTDTVDCTYYLYISNGYCTDTLEQNVKLSSIPGACVQTDYACYGQSFTYVADTTGANCFVWSSTPLLTDTLNNSIYEPEFTFQTRSARTFYLYRSNGACEALDTFKVKVSLYNASIDSVPSLCKGDTIHADVNIGMERNSSVYSTYWSVDQGIINADSMHAWMIADTSVMLMVEVVNEYGCKVHDTIYIEVGQVQLNAEVEPIWCNGDSSGAIVLHAAGGKFPYTYTWKHTSYNTDSLTHLSEGIYEVHVCEGTGCCTDTVIQLLQPDILQVSLYDTLSVIYCDAECKGKASVNISGGTMPYSLLWNTGDTSLHMSHLCPGEYVLQVEDAHHCADTILFTVKDTSGMSVQYEAVMPQCYNDCNGSIQLTVSGAVEPCEYEWNVTGGYTDKADNLCAGNYDIMVKDAHQCMRHIVVNMPNPELLILQSSVVNRPSCSGKNDAGIMVHMQGGTAPYIYRWNNVVGDSVYDNLYSGNYVLNVTDAHGCSYDTLFTVSDYDTLTAEVNATKVPCEEVCIGEAEVVPQGGCPPYRYVWTNGDTTQKAEKLCRGTYSVEVYDNNNCKVSMSVTVLDSSSFTQVAHAWADTNEIYRGQSTMLHADDMGAGFSYAWTPAYGLPVSTGKDVKASPAETTTYTLIVSDVYGCVKTDTVTLVINDVLCEEPFVFVPNAFSPNGDGVNDVLYVRGELLESIEFAVYDRWGEKLFETNTVTQGWNGTYKNKDCEPGVYVYYLYATCLGGVEYIHKGNVTLIR